jgi:hypothetical protein
MNGGGLRVAPVAMIRLAIAVVVIAVVTEPARAQNRPRIELAGGYQILNLQTFFPVGWFFEAAAPVSSGLTFVGQLNGYYRSVSTPSASLVPQQEHQKVHSFLAGARLVGRREDGLTAFFHLLAGGTRLGLTQVGGSTTELTLQAGGGFDFPLTSRWSGRVTADYVRLFTEGEPAHGIRVAIGWVVPLGR